MENINDRNQDLTVDEIIYLSNHLTYDFKWVPDYNEEIFYSGGECVIVPHEFLID